MEYKLSATAYESTFEFHDGRPAAHHIDEDAHRLRFDKTLEFITSVDPDSVVDLGAGDGGLLSRLGCDSWGYDFHVPNVQYAKQTRNVDVREVNFVENIDSIELGSLVVMTEVIEHLEDPHGVLRALASRGPRMIVCSSPVNETDAFHCEEHVWAWDFEGYEQLLRDSGWEVVRHEVVFPFQVVLANVGS